MNTLPTYETQRQKIIDAYFKDEIKPFSSSFCFCGTLAGNKPDWNDCQQSNANLAYTHQEFKRMEQPLLDTVCLATEAKTWISHFQDGTQVPVPLIKSSPNYEQGLFEGMAASLEVLKQIHIERGEVIDQVPVFTKRVLATS